MTEQNPNIPDWARQPQQPTGWGPTPQPPKKSHRTRNIVLGVVGAVIVIGIIGAATGGGKKNDNKPAAAAPSATATTQQPAATPATTSAAPAPTTTKPKPKPKPDTVEYIVTGSPADVTYGPAGSSLSGHSGMHVTKKLADPTYYSISAQLAGSGKVTCEIKVKGKVVSKGTATGSYNIAMCEIVKDPFGGGWQDANSN
jgi:hypothetical protein